MKGYSTRIRIKNQWGTAKTTKKGIQKYTKFKSLVNKINNIQEPGNSKMQETKENPKISSSLQTRTKSTGTCNSIQKNQNPKKKKKKKKNPLV